MKLISTAYAVNLQETLWQGTKAQSTTATSPYNLISTILPNLYVIAGLILLAYFVFAGVVQIASANNPQQADKGKTAATNALIGFLIIFGSYWLIQLVQYITGIPILGSNI